MSCALLIFPSTLVRRRIRTTVSPLPPMIMTGTSWKRGRLFRAARPFVFAEALITMPREQIGGISVSGTKDFQTLYTTPGTGRFSGGRLRIPRSRGSALFREMRRFAPADTNIVTGLEVPNGYDPLFSRGDNAAGGTRLVPVLPEPCGATEILFACQFSSLRGKLQPFPHGEGDWESRIRISTRQDAAVTFQATMATATCWGKHCGK